MTLVVIESDVNAKTAAEAKRIVRDAVRARGFVIADWVRQPYSVGRGRWRVQVAAVKQEGD